MQNSTISLKKYVSVVSYLLFKASQFVKECAENPNLKKYDKGGNDPVTDADFKIQTYLIKGIRHFFPNLRIVGEETKDYEGPLNLDFSYISLENFPSEGQFEENVPIDELCLWIDPIDNTRGFVKGTLDLVTILVGMARNNLPYLGFIATPYKKVKQNRTFEPRIYLGYTLKSKAFVTREIKSWVELKRPSKRQNFSLVTSDRVNNHKLDEIAESLGGQVQRLGGSGSKINMVIDGSADALVYIGEGNCRWDSCAGEAIVKALGGVYTNQKGQQIIYKQGANYLNDTGNICTLSPQLHGLLVKEIALLQYKK